ncbi:uncharacterized protein LOC131627941 [Vicia villosa]|uniref:uncharacterized protein LOC131627941 n=1 Tax=Vicia villosa TaxID=3911 RepID=UPI00273B0D31|nr:uncharacterized protein LOC131627941 [Vicia villosa]
MDIQKSYDTVESQAVEDILSELSFPNKFISWTMTTVKTISYKYKVNNVVSDILQAKRGLRQGDSSSLILFVLVMEYLHSLQNLGKNPNFNFHSKYEKLKIINLSFADDLLLFTSGDISSVNLALQSFKDFLKATELEVNPFKCKAYFGNVYENVKQAILRATAFA